MQALILQLTNLTSRIKSNIKIINGNKYLDVYLKKVIKANQL